MTNPNTLLPDEDITFRPIRENRHSYTFLTLFVFFLILSSIVFSNTTRYNNPQCLAQNANDEETKLRAANFQINELTSFEDKNETATFYSGKTLTVKCKITHDEGVEKITGAKLTLKTEDETYTLLQAIEMEYLNKSIEFNWKWFIYNYTFQIPTQRGQYEVIVTAKSNSTGNPENNSTILIEILNEAPKIIGTINPIYKEEDALPWILDLSDNKSDLEDIDPSLKWHITNVNESLLSIDVNDDIITFNLIQNAFGDNQLTLTLEDSDEDSVYLEFWLFVASKNDLPVIYPRIPDQEECEDCAPWSLNLTSYVTDVEDSNANKLLNWTVKDVNEKLITVVFNSNSTATLMNITPVKNAHGANIITLHVRDSDSGEVTQKLWINITSENDEPVWKDIPVIKLHNPVNIGILDLYDYISDYDTVEALIDLKISSTVPDFIICTIAHDGKLNVSINNTKYIGAGTIIVAAYDGTNYISTTINLTIQLASFTVQLLAPENSSIVTNTTPKLHWLVNNPSNIENIYFDIYLSVDENGVLNHDNSARVEHDYTGTSFSNYYELLDDQKYYWSVVPKYIDENNVEYFGSTAEDFRLFRVVVNSGNQPPFSVLLSPKPREVFSKTSVNLTWLGYDPDNDKPISYELYISTDKAAVSEYNEEVKIDLPVPTNNNFVLTDLEDNEIYYWSVIPIAKGHRGKCLDPVGTFAIDLFNTEPKTVLLLPKDEMIVQNPPILYWEYIDPDPFEDLFFDIYWSTDRSRVEQFDPQTRMATVIKMTNYYFPSLISNKKYYWTVISHDKNGSGVCVCGVWSFTIDPEITNHPPTTHLIGPENNEVIYENNVELSWNSSDFDGDAVNYTIYFSDDFNAVKNLDINSKLIITLKETISKQNLSHGKRYYWTVVPDDGKVPGVCLDDIWSFNIDLDKNPALDDKDSTDLLRSSFLQLIILLIIFSILVISLAWVIRKNRLEKRFRKYIDTGSSTILPSELKENILSTSTLRALHAREPENTQEDARIKEKLGILTRTSNTTRYAEHVKHAIPYASGTKKKTQISSKEQIELAQPLSKKIITEKPLKASSMPITRECPKCGSFKVKTYKDDTSKCLDCKFRF